MAALLALSAAAVLATPPANDDFEARTALAGVSLVIAASNLEATRQPGEPTHAGSSGGRSLWWSWIAPARSEVTLSTQGSTFDSVLAVYTGSSLESLERVAANDEAPDGSGSSLVQFRAEAGTAYHIAVDGFAAFSVAAGDVSLALQASPVASPPANDRFADAIVLAGDFGSVQGTLAEAGVEAGEPDTLNRERTAWWRWTAPAAGRLEFRLQDASGLLFTKVYTGDTLATLTAVQQSQKANDRNAYLIEVQAGTEYRFSVGLRIDLPAGPYNLSWVRHLPSANDAFADRVTLVGSEATFHADLLAATDEPGEPIHIGIGSTRSAWWTWTAPNAGAAKMVTGLSGTVAVYTGAALAQLAPETGRRHISISGGNIQEIEFPAQAGTTYQLAAATLSSAADAADVTLRLTPVPSNDHFAARIPLLGTDLLVSGSNVGATSEPNEPRNDFGLSRSVWYTWTAPAAGIVHVEVSETHVVVPYRGSSLGSLVFAGPGSVFNKTDVAVEEGSTLQFWIDGAQGRTGDFDLRLTLHPPPLNDAFDSRLPLGGTLRTLRCFFPTTTAEFDEPPHHPDRPMAEHSLWWSWTPPVSGELTLTTYGVAFPGVFAVYTGDTLTELVPVAFSETLTTNQSGVATTVELRADVRAGTRYAIAIDAFEVGSGPAVDELSLLLFLQPAPANDDFDNAEVRTDAAWVGTTSNRWATAEVGEPAHGGIPASNSVWWRWTAPGNGSAQVTPSPPRRLAVYTGSTVDSLTEQAGSPGPPAIFRAVAGTTYHIALDGGPHDNTTEPVSLALTTLPPPPNDDFAARLSANGTVVSAIGSIDGATREPGEPAHAQFPPAAGSIWWTWTAPSSGPAVVHALDGPLPALVGVYVGNALAELAPVGTGSSRVRFFTAAAGTTYALVVATSAGITGDVRLDLAMLPGPVNDAFANRIPASGDVGRTFGVATGATREPGEPDHADQPGGASVWWSWVAPVTGLFQMSAADSTFASLLGVYTGDHVGQLSPVVSSRGGPVRFLAQAGTAYALAVDAVDPQPGLASLSWQIQSTMPTVALGAAANLQSLTNADGSVSFQADVPVVNETAVRSGPLRLYVVARPGWSKTVDAKLPAVLPPDRSLGMFPAQPPLFVEPGRTEWIAVGGRIPAPSPPAIHLGFGWGAFVDLEQGLESEWQFVTSAPLALGTWPSVSGFDGPGGGVIRLEPGTSTKARHPVEVRIALGPPEAVKLGAGWRVLGSTNNFQTNAVTGLQAYSDETILLEFNPVKGWLQPTSRTYAFPAQATLLEIFATYTKRTVRLDLTSDPMMPMMPNAPWHLELDTCPGNCQIEFSLDLGVSGWTVLTNLTAGDRIRVPIDASGSRGFYRGLWTP